MTSCQLECAEMHGLRCWSLLIIFDWISSALGFAVDVVDCFRINIRVYKHKKLSQPGRVSRIIWEAKIVSKPSFSFRQPFWRHYPCHISPQFHLFNSRCTEVFSEQFDSIKVEVTQSSDRLSSEKPWIQLFLPVWEMLSRYRSFRWAEVPRENNFRRYSGKLKSFVW